ncbi:MAG: hypothetical protein ISR48_06385 [Alphaproteobacteria bacterium]|nr:hypothetical protein [Alphaproteobacteria bacterium]
MMTFNEFNDDDLDESAGRSNWVKVAAVGLQAKINSIGNQITSTNDVAKKIDLLSSQIKWAAGLSTLSIATDLQDRTIMKGLRK